MMAEYTFLYKTNEEDRDCCAYVELDRIGKLECGHYFPSVGLHGANYSGGSFASYDNIQTILTETEYTRLVEYAKAISELGYGIKKEDSRYTVGINLTKSIQDIVVKLKSSENDNFFYKIQKEEVEFIADEYGLTEDEVWDVFEQSPYGYKDRGLISYVWDDAEDVAREYCDSTGEVDGKSFVSNYIDYEEMGSDMVSDSERYIKLSDGRILEMSL